MKTYPRNRRTAAEVYRDTETLDAGGYFPLGLNSSWHSGIHVRSNAQDPIYPLLPGRVVALRVNDVPQEIDRLKEIPLAEYAALPPQIQALYGPLQNKDTGDCSDELQQARAIAKSYSMKELISSGPETREEFSTGFVLVRHEVPLYKKDNENKEKIVFFTLYVNLLSYTQLPCAVPPDYTPLAGMFHDKNTPLALPFYRKWLFRLSGSLPERKFFTAGGNEMYLLSHCAVKSEKCFHRALPEELICEAGDGGEAGRFTLPSRDIEIFPDSVTLRPTGAGVELYHTAASSEKDLASFKIAELKEEACIELVRDSFGSSSWQFRGNYISVAVQREHVEPASLREGWLCIPPAALKAEDIKKQGFAQAVTDAIGKLSPTSHTQYKVLFAGTDEDKRSRQVVFQISEGSAQPWSFREYREKSPGKEPYIIVRPASLREKAPDIYKKYTENFPGKDGDFLVLCAGRLFSAQKAEEGAFLFYQGPKKCAALSTGASSGIADLHGFFNGLTLPPPPDFKVLVSFSMTIVRLGDTIEVNEAHKPAFAFLRDGEGMSACRYYVQETKPRTLLVKADKMVLETARGRIRSDSRGKMTQTRRGLMVYETDAFGSASQGEGWQTGDLPQSNVKRCLEGGREFEFAAPEDFLKNRAEGLHNVICKDGDKEKAAYIHITRTDIQNIEVKAAKKDYLDFNTICMPSEDVTQDTVLGYPAQDSHLVSVYDLALFFRDDSFLDRGGELAPVVRYHVPQTKTVYRVTRERPLIRSFPAKTVFAIIETDTEGTRKAYKVKWGEDIIFGDKTPHQDSVPVRPYPGDIFWLKAEDIPQKEAAVDLKSMKITLKKDAGLSYTTQNPFRCDIFFPVKKRLGWSDETSFSRTVSGSEGKEFGSQKIQRWEGFTSETQEVFYLPQTEFESLKKNYEKWEDFFIRAKDPENDIFCDFQKEILPHLKLSGTAKSRARQIKTGEELKALFHNQEKNEEAEIVRNLRRLVCKHPLEWNKEAFSNIHDQFWYQNMFSASPDALRYLNEKLAALDFWQRVKDIEDIKPKSGSAEEPSVWCAHPIYFVEHLDKLGAFEFNPYLGQRFKKDKTKMFDPATQQMKEIDFVVKDNPGFAPYAPKHVRAMPSGYLKPTSFFNEDFLDAHKNDKNKDGSPRRWSKYYHEGVDFGCEKTTPIHSLIYGKVMCVGTHLSKAPLPDAVHERSLKPNGMGDFMIVQDMQDKFKYYLLLHLWWNSWNDFEIKEDSSIVPGQPIARVGHADPDKENWHLHISVLRSTEYLSKPGFYTSRNFNTGNNLIYNNIEKYDFPIWGRKKDWLNPFDHKDSTWAGRE